MVTSLTSLTAGLGSQVSLAVGAVNPGVAGHSIVALAPAAERVGGVVSATVMVWLTVVEALPEQSVAYHVLVRL